VLALLNKGVAPFRARLLLSAVCAHNGMAEVNRIGWDPPLVLPISLRTYSPAPSLALPGLVFGLRMRLEEAALVEAFGAEYRAYMRRTKRLIPFLF
jgi:protein-S-isoprenylcysteine O-methyltransferase Ste14